MARIKDITGQKLGRLTVIKPSHKNKAGLWFWDCLCDCGNRCTKNGQSLRTGHTQSCGKCPKFKDITGERFGKLTVIKPSHPDRWGVWYWLCKCDCGNEFCSRGVELRLGKASSCGCLTSEKLTAALTTHNLSHSRVYQIHANMLQRCNNPKSYSYKNYGGRGITVCEEWRTFEGFWGWAQYSGYTDKLTIERINVNGNYGPENCTWIPLREQSKNTRATTHLTYNNETLSIAEWIKKTGISRGTLNYRLYVGKWSIEKALTTPVQKYTRK